MGDLVATVKLVAIMLFAAVFVLVFGHELRPLVEVLVRWAMQALKGVSS